MLVTRKVFNQYYFERALVLDKYNLGTAANIEPALKSKKSIISSALQEMLNKVSNTYTYILTVLQLFNLLLSNEHDDDFQEPTSNNVAAISVLA